MPANMYPFQSTPLLAETTNDLLTLGGALLSLFSNSFAYNNLNLLE
jgi:hypothetical protein